MTQSMMAVLEWETLLCMQSQLININNGPKESAKNEKLTTLSINLKIIEEGRYTALNQELIKVDKKNVII